LRFKKTARASKKRATQYRERLKMAMNFDIKLRNTVLGNDAINFCLAQLKKRNVQVKGRRYTTDEKIFASALFKQSGRAYTKLRQIFALPTRQTMMGMLNKVPITAGFNKVIFQNLKNAVSKLSNRDKLCTQIFDEMSIMPHIMKLKTHSHAPTKNNNFAHLIKK
jgi:hypothetical protein